MHWCGALSDWLPLARAPAGGWTVGTLFDAIAEGSPGYGDHSFFEGLNKGRFGFSVFWGS